MDKRFITFQCECGQTINAPAERAGAKGRCKACGRTVIVPSERGDVLRVNPPRPPLQKGGTKGATSPSESISRAPIESIPTPPSESILPAYLLEKEGEYSEEDLITHPNERPIRKEAPPPAPAEEKSLFGMLGEILTYPFSDKMATQIFLSGAILFSPLVWLPVKPFLHVPCLGVILFLIFLVIVISVRLMYFSYLLLIIEKSAEGSRVIPELPVFQSWDQHLGDLIKVLGASAIAFAPYLVYAASVNIEVLGRMLEAYSTGKVPGVEVIGDVSNRLEALVLLYAIAAFYMPMALMALVTTRSFVKAVNPVFILRSIVRVWREYLAAMLIIFFVLRGGLTLFTILKDVLAADWFSAAVGYVAEPILKFYAFVVTMHVIGLLYHRNKDMLEW